MSQSRNAKKIRQQIARHEERIQQSVAMDVITGMYRMPFWRRVKWALKIVRGLKSDVDHLLYIMWQLIWFADSVLERLVVHLAAVHDKLFKCRLDHHFDKTHYECPECGLAVPHGQKCHHNL